MKTNQVPKKKSPYSANRSVRFTDESLIMAAALDIDVSEVCRQAVEKAAGQQSDRHDRAYRFIKLRNHPMLGKSWQKLSDDEIKMTIHWLIDRWDLSASDLARAAVRIWLDQPKPKNWSRIEELIIAVMSQENTINRC